MALYTAPFGRRLAAALLDGVAVAVLLAGTVHAANAAGALWGVRPFDPFWETPVVVHTTVEKVGEPSTVRHEGGIERTTAFSRETRVYADGSLRIFSVIEGHARFPDGTESSGRADSMIGESRSSYWRTRATYALIGVLLLVYFGAFEASSLQATPGKQLLALRVTDLKGKRLTPLRAWLRQVAKLATAGTSGFGYLTALFTTRGQTLHDVLAGTLVATTRGPAS